jgi:hypothetical protein
MRGRRRRRDRGLQTGTITSLVAALAKELPRRGPLQRRCPAFPNR